MNDSTVYQLSARTIREKGWRRGFKVLAQRYLKDSGANHYPSPLRWGWLLFLRYVRNAPLFGALLLPLVAANVFTFPIWGLILLYSSPLLWICGRNTLQDACVAALVFGAMGAAHAGSYWTLPAVFALLAFKDLAGALYLPVIALMWLLGGWPLVGLVQLPIAALAWLLAARYLLGRDTRKILLASVRGHNTDYTKAHQRGGGHRLLVDLLLVSPLPLILFLVGTTNVLPYALLLAVLIPHAIAPVQNVRTILVADIILRIGAALTIAQVPPMIGLVACASMLVIDIISIRRTREVYDPVTQNLTSSLFTAT